MSVAKPLNFNIKPTIGLDKAFWLRKLSVKGDFIGLRIQVEFPPVEKFLLKGREDGKNFGSPPCRHIGGEKATHISLTQ